MVVMFSARRLKPGAWEQFRRAWDPGDNMPPGSRARLAATSATKTRSSRWPVRRDDRRLHRWRGEAEAGENQQVDRLSAFVENDPVSGVYEVIDEVDA